MSRFAQLDSATDEDRRMCFFSTCAMLLAFLKPGVLTGPNGDDQYLARVHQFGDSNQARFSSLEERIAAAIPVPCDKRGRVICNWSIIKAPTPSGITWESMSCAT